MDEFESSLRVDSPQRRERGDASGGIVAAVRKVVVGERSGGAPFDRRREGRKKTLADKSGIDVEMAVGFHVSFVGSLQNRGPQNQTTLPRLRDMSGSCNL